MVAVITAEAGRRACDRRIDRIRILKILVIGDVTSPRGAEHLENKLWKFREREGIDFCVVNGENASFITGISRELAEKLIMAGADVITGGNHTLHNKAAYQYLEDSDRVLRPVNFGNGAPGRGYTVVDCLGYRMLVINAMGNVHIEPNLDSPYGFIDRVLAREEGNFDFDSWVGSVGAAFFGVDDRGYLTVKYFLKPDKAKDLPPFVGEIPPKGPITFGGDAYIKVVTAED